jgi:hypothetical protein
VRRDRKGSAPATAQPVPPEDQPPPDREPEAPAAQEPRPTKDQPDAAQGEPAPDTRPAAAAAAAAVPAAAEAVPDDPRDAIAAASAGDQAHEPDPAAARAEADTAAVPTPTVPASTPRDPAAPSVGKAPDPKRKPGRRQHTGGPPPTPAGPSMPPPGPIPAGGRPAGESDQPRPQQPAAQAAPAPAEPATPSEAPAPAATGGQEPEAETRTRPGSGPLGVAPDGPEALLAAAEAAATPPGPLLGTPARPLGTAPPGAEGAPAPGEDAPDRRHRGRRARSLLRFTAPKRPEATEREAAASDEPQPLADFDRLTASIESVTEALGGQPLEFYERDLPQIAAAETARRVRADVVVLLLDNGEGLMEVSGGVGLTPAERRLSVEYSRDVMRELFRAGVGLIEDTDRVRGALAGIPGSRSETLVMVPLVHERLGFGVLMAGRNRSQTGVPTEVFTDAEIEVLMGFADAAAASLRTAVLLRHLKGQLRALEEDG